MLIETFTDLKDQTLRASWEGFTGVNPPFPIQHYELQSRLSEMENTDYLIGVLNEGNAIVGLLPLEAHTKDILGLMNDFLPGAMPPLDTRQLRRVVSNIPLGGRALFLLDLHPLYDLSADFRDVLFEVESGCFRLDSFKNEDEYLRLLSKKARYNLKRIREQNYGTSVREGTGINQGLLDHYLKQWDDGLQARQTAEFLRFWWEKHQEQFIILDFYVDDNLIGQNIALKFPDDYVADVVFLQREEGKALGLGIFAIFQNIQHCSRLGAKFYDLGAVQDDFYKRQFLPNSSDFKSGSFVVFETEEQAKGQEMLKPPFLIQEVTNGKS